MDVISGERKRYTCEVCKEKIADGCCPKCKVRFCSKACYQQHNEACTSAFAEEHMKQNMSAATITDDDKKKMAKILMKLHEEGYDEEAMGMFDEEDDGPSGPGLYEDDEGGIPEERLFALTQLAQEGKLELNMLTEEEEKMFMAALHGGELREYVEPFEPWWNSLVVTANEPVDHLCCGGSSEFNPRVGFILLQVLFGYVHMMRKFNGDIWEQRVDAVLHLRSIVPVVTAKKSDQVPSGAGPALASCLEAVAKGSASLAVDGNSVHQLNIKCLEDVERILKVQQHVDRAVQETALLFKSVVNVSNSESLGNGDACLKKEQIRALKSVGIRGQKKSEYLRSFSYHHYLEFNVILVNAVQLVISQLREVAEKDES